MFCPYCGRQNEEEVVFCAFCGKALSQKGLSSAAAQHGAPKAGVSFTKIKAAVTVLLIVGLALVVVQIYYPGVFPWNW